MELGEISNKQCLQQSAYINAAIKANRTSTLVNVPDKPIEPKDVTFLLFTRSVNAYWKYSTVGTPRYEKKTASFTIY